MTRINTTVGNYEHLKDILKNETVYIIGSGPSLLGYDYKRLAGKKVISVNHALFELLESGIIPNYHIFLDYRFLQECKLTPDNLPVFSITSSHSTIAPRIDKLAVIKPENKFSLDPVEGFFSPRNSIAFAISVSIYMGVKEINLLGADCAIANREQAYSIARKNGNMDLAVFIQNSSRKYWVHSTSHKYNHTKDEVKHSSIFEVMQVLFDEFKGKTETKIYNCSQLSKIQTFERKSLP